MGRSHLSIDDDAGGTHRAIRKLPFKFVFIFEMKMLINHMPGRDEGETPSPTLKLCTYIAQNMSGFFLSVFGLCQRNCPVGPINRGQDPRHPSQYFRDPGGVPSFAEKISRHGHSRKRRTWSRNYEKFIDNHWRVFRCSK